MRMRLVLVLGVLVPVLAGGVGFAQSKSDEAAASSAQTEQSDGRHYQVVFVAQEVERGRVINARRYATDMALQGPMSGSGSIRTGSKVPIATGSYSTGASVGAQTQFTYSDIGFNVDFNHARLEGDRVFLYISAALNSAETPPSDSPLRQPTIKQNSWTSGVTVTLGKPTVVFSSDDVASKRAMQIELTVTPVR